MVVMTEVPIEEVNSALPCSPFNLNLWPSLEEAHGRLTAPYDRLTDNEWELLSGNDDNLSNASNHEAVHCSTAESSLVIVSSSNNSKVLHISSSTPDFDHFDTYSESSFSSAKDADAVFTVGEDFSFVDKSDDAQSRFTTDYTLVSCSPSFIKNVVTNDSVPSVEGNKTSTFKDVLSMNAQQMVNHNSTLMSISKPLKSEYSNKHKKHTSRLPVVVPIQRCTTGGLKSPVSSIQEEHENVFGLRRIQEDVFLGDTDSMEFYYQKRKGEQNWVNNRKLRPDGAKRKQRSINKRNAQRQQHTNSC